MPGCNTYYLDEVVDKLFIDKLISKKKYFSAYLNIAKDSWNEICRNTIWNVQSKWMTLKKGTPYNYIDVPDNASIIYGVGVEDKCKLIQPLFYNNQLNILSKPAEKKCGCKEDCECGGVCESANSFSYSTKLLFTINGVDYYEKIWLETCSNGDVIEFKQTPTKKYNNITGDGGDYNEDYNDDYDIEPAPFSDYTIVTVESQRKICKLETLECGCPAETEENAELLTDTCGCQLNFGCSLKRKHCRQYFQNIDNNYYGEVKISQCGSKIYYKPSPHWRKVSDVEFPEFLLVNFGMNAVSDARDTLIPDYAVNLLKTDINWRANRFNTAIPLATRQDFFYQKEMEADKVIAFLNPVSLIELGKIQDQKIAW